MTTRRAPGLARVAAALVLVGALVVGAAAVPATAQEAGEQLTIREVDTTGFPLVRLSAISNGADLPQPEDFSLRENGSFVGSFDLVPVSETARQIGTVLVIDTSGSMTSGGAIDQAKAAAKQYVDQRAAQDRIAVVAFSDQATVVQRFTDDGAALNAAIDALVADGETALWDGVTSAAALLAESPDLQANVVVLSDGTDTASGASLDLAIAAVRSAKATVFSVGLPGGDFDEGPVRRLAEETGGTYTAAADPASLSAVYGSVQRAIQGQFEIQYTSTSDAATLQLALSTDLAQARAEAPVGAVVEGTAATPRIIEASEGALQGDTGLLLAIGLGFVAVALAAWAILRSAVHEESTLVAAIRPYDADADRDDGADTDLVQTPIVQRAVDYTERFARRQGLLPVVEGALEKADLPIRPAEALFFYGAGVLVFGVLGYLLTGAVLATFLILLVLVLAPPAVVSFLGGKRQRDFVAQLPDTLQLLAGSLRAGYSLMQGLEAVSREVQEPMGKELRRVLVESRLGRPVEDALDDAATRIQSPDFSWAVMAIRIQREVGGNLAELLVTVAETMTSRERLRRDIRSLTAEGRVSAIVLAILPVAIGAAVYVLNREYMSVLLDETIGQVMLACTAVLALLGFVWLKKTIEIEV